jgi:CheY-like chemotaxis protein
MPHGTTAPQLRILLVDEQAAARDLVIRTLGALKYRLDSVASGRDALVRARQVRADLILLSATLT